MKQIFRTLLLTLMMIGLSTATFAQNSNNHQRLTREQLAEKQAKHIAKELAFDEQTTDKFTTTFMAYQRDVWALGKRPETAKERLEHSQKLLDLRSQYYDKYAQFLTDQQIDRVYKLERQMMRRMADKGHKRKAGHQRNRRK